MTKRVVNLPDIPGAGEELEDYVAALFQASGHFVEKQLVESDPADLLELDIVSTDYTHEEVVRQLIEVKGGGWGYTDLFKVVGLMQYLKIDRGAFFITKWDKRESAPSRMEPLGLNVVCFNDFKAAPEHFSQKGFGTFVEPDLIELWQHSYGVERRFIKLLHQQARRKGEEGAKAAKIYHRQINNGTFFARAPEESLAMLYEAYSEHPKLTRGYAHELDGGAFDPQSMNPQSASYTAMLGGKFPELQACSYLEHRARLSILKSAVDYALAHPDGAPELGMSEDGKTWFFEGLTYHALPATFHSGMAWLREQPSFRRYATFWQQLLWGWGGFYLDDREQEEFEWMSKYSGIPDDEIPVALEAFDRFFPIPGGWFVTAGRTDVRMVKMVPWIFQGIGAHHRRVQYELSDLSGLNPSAPYTVSDLAKRINCAVDFLLDH
ncbi:hypothetical protein N4G69_47015 [Streptomyces mirabilis]|uniref:hypothetical protein n=1 Tax=Streptomyces mirabilis TaxID=68239 RepID=UPI0021C009CD|nr:hypothetical protein [Streptomyces mirabilis]MCT9112994.1 hypothetical protein [Streptomyces mirabilis]